MTKQLHSSRPFRFEIRADGLYRRTGRGEWRRILRRKDLAALAYVLVSLIEDNGRSGRGPNPLHQIGHVRGGKRRRLTRVLKAEKAAQIDRLAVSRIRRMLRDRDGIVELRLGGVEAAKPERLGTANGFVVVGPGRNSMFAIKPDAMRNWAGKDCRFRAVLDQFDDNDWLLRGADGKTTRQVQIPGLGRCRYYCFALEAGRKPDPEPGAGLQPLSRELTAGDDQARSCPAQLNPQLAKLQSVPAAGDDWQAGGQARAVGGPQTRSRLPRTGRGKGRGATAWEDDLDEDPSCDS